MKEFSSAKFNGWQSTNYIAVNMGMAVQAVCAEGKE